MARTAAFGLSYAATAFYLQLLPIGKALAVSNFGGTMGNINVASEGTDIKETIVKVINWALGFLALIAVIFVIVGGFRIMMAGGNEENVTKGRKTIIYAIIGLVVVFFARVIVGLVTSNLGNQVP